MTGDDELVTDKDLAEWGHYHAAFYADVPNPTSAAVLRLIKTVCELRAVLKSVEWDGYIGDSPQETDGWRVCPSCVEKMCYGHSTDCRLARAIGADRG